MVELTGGRENKTALPVRDTLLVVGAIYVAARLVTTMLLMWAAEGSGEASRFGAYVQVSDLIVAWDADWYRRAATDGYPSMLPVGADGLVSENTWAFMPLFAYLAAGAGALFGSWCVGALIVALVCGYFACVVFFRMLAPRIGVTAAACGVAFFASSPMAALFQVGYAESMFLLLLFLAIWAVMQRRFAWLYLLIPLAGYTRPGILAFALFLGLYGISRWLTRRSDPLPWRHIVHIVAAGALAVVVGFSWQVFAGIVTGNPDAYLLTELAWRRPWVGDAASQFVPFDGFILAAGVWSAIWGWASWVGYTVLAGIVALFVAALIWDQRVRKLGIEVRLWSASYALYLLAVFFPQSSIFRLLVPLSPLWGAVAVPRAIWWRVAVLGACIAGQALWIYQMYALANQFWQIP